MTTYKFGKAFIINSYDFLPVKTSGGIENRWLGVKVAGKIGRYFKDTPYFILVINVEDKKYHLEMLTNYAMARGYLVEEHANYFKSKLRNFFTEIADDRLYKEIPEKNRYLFVQYKNDPKHENYFNSYLSKMVDGVDGFDDRTLHNETIPEILQSQPSLVKKLLTKSKGLGKMFVGSIFYLVTFTWLVEMVKRFRGLKKNERWSDIDVTTTLLGISPRKMMREGRDEIRGGFDIKSWLAKGRQMLQTQYGSEWFEKVGRKLKAMAPDKLKKLIKNMIEWIRKKLGRPPKEEMSEYRVDALVEAMQGNTQKLEAEIKNVEGSLSGGSNYYKHKYMKYKYKYLKIK